MAKILGLTPKDFSRVGNAVRDFESRPPRLPLPDTQHVKTTARPVIFELVSETPDADGRFTIILLRRKADGTGYESISSLQVKLEDINA